MSHSTFRPAPSRSATLALALTAFFALTGAKGGCFGEVITAEEPGCGEGFKAVEVCVTPLIGCLEGADCVLPEPSCELQCAPADGCEPGFHLEQVCEAYAFGMPDCQPDQDCPAPPPPTCFDQCVPDNVCGPGYHVETICEAVAQGVPDCPPNADCAVPPPAEPVCYDQCVADDDCGPGHRLEKVCETAPVVDCAPGEACAVPAPSCYLSCVPEGCAPGFHEEWICQDVLCAEDQACPAVCDLVCVEDGGCGGGDPEPLPEPVPSEKG